MLEAIDFDKNHYYNTLEVGITVPIVLHYGDITVDFEAKIDTGSSFCIFERTHGERLGLDIESGQLESFGTATGSFLAYGHELKLSVLDIETTSTVFFAKEESFTRNVLGRTGWLDRVKLGLIDYEGKLLLSAYND